MSALGHHQIQNGHVHAVCSPLTLLRNFPSHRGRRRRDDRARSKINIALPAANPPRPQDERKPHSEDWGGQPPHQPRARPSEDSWRRQDHSAFQPPRDRGGSWRQPPSSGSSSGAGEKVARCAVQSSRHQRRSSRRVAWGGCRPAPCPASSRSSSPFVNAAGQAC